MICNSCKKPISDDTIFCRHCGTKAEAVALSEMQQSSNTVHPCTVCGAKLEAIDVFCTSCGAPVSNKATPQPANSCAACGAVLEKEDTFCTGCGGKVNQNSNTPYPNQNNLPDPNNFEKRLPQKCLSKANLYQFEPITCESMEEYIGYKRKYAKSMYTIPMVVFIVCFITMFFPGLILGSLINILVIHLQSLIVTIKLCMHKNILAKSIDLEDLRCFFEENLSKYNFENVKLKYDMVYATLRRKSPKRTIGRLIFSSDATSYKFDIMYMRNNWARYRHAVLLHSIFTSVVEIYMEDKGNV